MKRLTDLRPCDNCGGPVGLLFYTLRLSLTLVKPQAVNEYLGMAQFFGGRASSALIENFAPASADAVTVAGDKDPSLMTEIVLCSKCYLDQPIVLPLLSEKRRDAIERAEAQATS